MMKREIEIVLPEFKEGKYVEYKVFNSNTDKMERYRIYKGFAKISDKNELQKHADKIIRYYSAKLRAGWRPWKKDTVIYKDELEYYTISNKFGNQKVDKFYIRKYTSDFLVALTDKHLAKKSVQTYKSRIRTFIHWIRDTGREKFRPAEITNEIIKEFFEFLIEKDLDRVTIGKYKDTLNRFFHYCIEKKAISKNPIYDIQLPPKKKDEAARPMLDVDVQNILNEAARHNPQFLLACLFQMLCCCRPNELRFIKIKDIDLFNCTLFISSEGGKTGARHVQMPMILTDVCRQMNIYDYNRDYYLFSKGNQPGTEQLAVNHLGNIFREVRKKLNLPKTYKFYSFKHTGAGKLLESGATVVEVMKLLGHTSLESTIHYIHRHFGDKSDKVANFYPDAIRGVADYFGKS